MPPHFPLLETPLHPCTYQFQYNVSLNTFHHINAWMHTWLQLCMCFFPAVVQLSKSYDFFGENLNIINTRVRQFISAFLSRSYSTNTNLIKAGPSWKKAIINLNNFFCMQDSFQAHFYLIRNIGSKLCSRFPNTWKLVDSLLNWIAELQCLVTQYVIKLDVLETSLTRYSAVCAL